ncbi:MAG: methyltransferase domain-containing protein, partial [bacterium]|nr:methyltransferase domain-containing protein [bacterium]
MSEWERHADWWLDEVAADPIYSLDVLPLAQALLGDDPGTVLDLGCGEGQMMRELDGGVIGCDISSQLLRKAQGAGRVIRCELPDLGWLRRGVVDSAVVVLVVEHLDDLSLFASAIRVVRPGGALVVVANHPAFTAEDAGPIMDPSDGEVLWRWGNYFEAAACSLQTDGAAVTFYHRPLADILNAAAEAGWVL